MVTGSTTTVVCGGRRAGTLMVCGQRVSLGRDHAHKILSIAVSDTTLAIDLEDGETRVVRRTNIRLVRAVKAAHRTATSARR